MLQTANVVNYINSDVKELLLEVDKLGGVVLGGFARYLASPHGQEAEDIDIYTTKANSYGLICDMLRDASITKSVNNTSGYNGVQGVATFLFKPNWKTKENFKIQVINVEERSVIDTLNTFDFTIVQAYYDINHNSVLVAPDWYEDEQNKRLRFHRIGYETGSIAGWRIGKYLKKGYYISDADLLLVFSSFEENHQKIRFLNSLECNYNIESRDDEPNGNDFKKEYSHFINMVRLYELDHGPLLQKKKVYNEF